MKFMGFSYYNPEKETLLLHNAVLSKTECLMGYSILLFSCHAEQGPQSKGIIIN